MQFRPITCYQITGKTQQVLQRDGRGGQKKTSKSTERDVSSLLVSARGRLTCWRILFFILLFLLDSDSGGRQETGSRVGTEPTTVASVRPCGCYSATKRVWCKMLISGVNLPALHVFTQELVLYLNICIFFSTSVPLQFREKYCTFYFTTFI